MILPHKFYRIASASLRTDCAFLFSFHIQPMEENQNVNGVLDLSIEILFEHLLQKRACLRPAYTSRSVTAFYIRLTNNCCSNT